MKTLIFTSLLALSFNAYAGSGIKGPSYDKIVESMKVLASQNAELAEVKSYGKSVKGRGLTVLKISDKRFQAEGGPAVVITGATHGDEYLNIADRLPGEFLERKPAGFEALLQRGGALYIVPIFNPDGYEKGKRGNANGADLNRDFDSLPEDIAFFKQPETRSFVEYLETELLDSRRRLALVIDYHCCANALLYPWSYTKTPLPEADLQAHRDIGQFMREEMGSDYQMGTTSDILIYTARGTSKDYYYAKHGALAFTYEGMFWQENKKLKKHVKMWDKIFTYLLD